MPEFDDALPANLCQDNGEIFFRSHDVGRFDRVFQAVLQEGQHLLMTSQYDGVIDHYGKMMLNRLKMRSGMAVETYMPASTEALVTRFNELVNRMSMEQARGEEPSDSPGRIIVVNDSKAIESDSWALLSRMITDFPGLNMRLVFLLDRLAPGVDKALDRFGSRILRWEIEPPSANEQLALRKEGMQAGLEFQVERVLSRINQTVSRQLEPNLDTPTESSLQIDVEEALGEATEAGEREAEDMRALFEEDAPPKKRGGGLLLAAAVVTLAVLATAVTGFVNPEVGRQLDRALQLVGVEETPFSREGGGQSVVDAAYDASQTETPESTAGGVPLPELAPLSEPETATPAIPETPRTDVTEAIAADATNPSSSIAPSDESTATTGEASLEPEVAVSEDAASTPVSSPQTVESETDSDAETVPVTEAENAATAAEPEAAATIAESTAIQAVRSAPATAQFVQHIVLATEARATAWAQTQTNLTEALVVPINVNGNTRFAVVSGPFIARETTRAFIQGLGEDADYWVRTAGSLQAIVQSGE